MSLMSSTTTAFPPFQSITDTVKTTGLSAYYLRRGIKDGSVPCVKSGAKYLINVPRLLESLDAWR